MLNPVIIAVVLMTVLCLLKINVLISIMISEIVAGLVAILQESKSEKFSSAFNLQHYERVYWKRNTADDFEIAVPKFFNARRISQRGEYHTLKIALLGMQLLKSEVSFSMIDKSENKKSKQIKTASYCITLELYNKGKSTAEIARARSH